MISRLLLFTLLIAGLTACAADSDPDAVLPTLAQLPAAVATDTPTPHPPTPEATAPPSATETATDAPSPTPTFTVTPSATITDTPSPTPSITPPATDTPSPTPRVGAMSLLAELAAQATVIPPQFQPTSAAAFPVVPVSTPIAPIAPLVCAFSSTGVFAAALAADPSLSAELGCPLSADGARIPAASQSFEGGSMLWLNGPIYALYSLGQLARFEDTFNPAVDPESGNETAPAARFEPVRGFGKVWRANPAARSGLGWALAPEAGGEGDVLRFERGLIVSLPGQRQVLALIEIAGGAGGRWRSVGGVN